MVAAHGNYDRPEWQCDAARRLVENRGFVLCPRGVRRRDSPSSADARYEYASGSAFEKEVFAALAALQSEYAAYVDAEAVTLVGFSLGAILGAGLLRRHAAQFPRAILIEGGFENWTPTTAAAFAKQGGQRLLFACGQSWCVQKTKAPASNLTAAGIVLRMVSAPREGHTYEGGVHEKVANEIAWLFEGDARWAMP